MSDPTSQAAAGVATEATTLEAAQANAATTQAQTDGADGGEGSPVAPKTFSQDDVNEIVRKAKAAAEAKAERRVLRTLERLQPQAAQPRQEQTQEAQRPSRRQGEADDDYFDRLTDWKLEQRDAKAAQGRQQQQAQSLTQKTEGIYAQAEKLHGFDREAFDELPLTKPIVEALVDSDDAPKLMHYMASHPEEVERIAKLAPARQAAELGKLEAKLPAAPLAKTSKAPDPVNPTASGKTSQVHDLQTASQAEYEAARKKQGARWA